MLLSADADGGHVGEAAGLADRVLECRPPVVRMHLRAFGVSGTALTDEAARSRVANHHLA